MLTVPLIVASLGGPASIVGHATKAEQGESRSIEDGVYTAGQAARGEESFRACTYCHGRDLRGGDDPPGPPLKGEIFLNRWSGKTVGDLWLRIAETMPRRNPGSLSPEAYADIVGYMLQANGMPAGAVDLQPDVDRLGAIAMRKHRRDE